MSLVMGRKEPGRIVIRTNGGTLRLGFLPDKPGSLPSMLPYMPVSVYLCTACVTRRAEVEPTTARLRITHGNEQVSGGPARGPGQTAVRAESRCPSCRSRL